MTTIRRARTIMRFYNTRQPKSLERYTDLLPSMNEDAAISVERYKKSLERCDKELLLKMLVTGNDNEYAEQIKKRYDIMAHLFRALEWTATLEVKVEQDLEELEKPYQDSIYSQQELRRHIKHQITQLELLDFTTDGSQSKEQRNTTIQCLHEQLKELDACIGEVPEPAKMLPLKQTSYRDVDRFKMVREGKKELEDCSTRIVEELCWFDPEYAQPHSLESLIKRRDTAIDNLFIAMEMTLGHKSLTSDDLLVDRSKTRRQRDELYGFWIPKELDYLQFCDDRLIGKLPNVAEAKPNKYQNIFSIALYLECRDRTIDRLFDAMEYEMEYEREWGINENHAEVIRRKIQQGKNPTNGIKTGQLEKVIVSKNLIDILKFHDEIEAYTQEEKIEDKDKTDGPAERKRRWVRKMDNVKAELDIILNCHREFLNDSFLLAAAKGDIKKMTELLDHDGVNLETRNSSDETALVHAVRSQKPEAVKFLLDRGADVNARDINDETPLRLASRLATITTNRQVANEIITLLFEAWMRPRN